MNYPLIHAADETLFDSSPELGPDEAARLAAWVEEMVGRCVPVHADRRRLPMVRITTDYRFTGSEGDIGLLDLFEGRRQLVLPHFMFDPAWEAGWVGCTAGADPWPTSSNNRQDGPHVTNAGRLFALPEISANEIGPKQPTPFRFMDESERDAATTSASQSSSRPTSTSCAST